MVSLPRLRAAEERDGVRRREPLSPALSPLVPRGAREAFLEGIDFHFESQPPELGC